MLSERITFIFAVLGCNNSDIARFIGCSPSHVSRIHNNTRVYSPTDKPIVRLAEGIYEYADDKNLLRELCATVKISSEMRDEVISAIITWLFDDSDVSLQQINVDVLKKTKRSKEAKSASFGEKLDAVMKLVGMSNTRLAKLVSVDDSHISRFRNGIRSPHSNHQLVEAIADALGLRAYQLRMLPRLAEMTGIDQQVLTDEKTRTKEFSEWLLDVPDNIHVTAIDKLLASFDAYSPEVAARMGDMTNIVTSDILADYRYSYWGTHGFREAMLRFLCRAREEAVELWLYTDEDTDWLYGDQVFHDKFMALLFACVKNGVSISIVHNLDRSEDELLATIQTWLPLYMSGNVHAYVSKKGRDLRFAHTMFLCPKKAAVYSSCVRGAEASNWHDYIKDTRKIAAIERDFGKLLSQSVPLFQRYDDIGSNPLNEQFFTKGLQAVLISPSLGTMPAELFEDIMDRNDIQGDLREQITGFYKAQCSRLLRAITAGKAYEYLPLVTEEDLKNGYVPINIASGLFGTELFYTPQEYARHVESMIELMEFSTGYHLYLLPQSPFVGMQVVKCEDFVYVVRAKKPYSVFVFREPIMCNAFSEYLKTLSAHYRTDRATAKQTLRRYL